MAAMGTIEAIERAKGYPFRQPTGSYLFAHDREHLLEGHPGTWEVDLDGLTPVFGYSSNPSPVALAHKFAAFPEVRIPVISFDLVGFDAVYSAHVSTGYVPATIHPSPGTTLHGFMTYLTDAELETMNDSESLGVNYELAELEGSGRFEVGRELEDPLTYIGLHGQLEIDGELRAVPGTRATDRRHKEMPQAEVLERVINEIAPGYEADQFIGSAIADLSQRKAWTTALRDAKLGEP